MEKGTKSLIISHDKAEIQNLVGNRWEILLNKNR